MPLSYRFTSRTWSACSSASGCGAGRRCRRPGPWRWPAGLGHRVHGGGHQRDVESDLAGEPGRGVDLGGHHFGRAGFEQNIVEGETFANLHGRLVEILSGLGKTCGLAEVEIGNDGRHEI